MNQQSKTSLLPVYFVLFIDNFAFAVIFAIFGPLFIDPSYGMVTAEMSSLSKNLLLGVALGLFPLGQCYILLILTRLITGFFPGNLSICLASIADLSPDEKTRAKNFSIIMIITGLSWMFAMLSGGYLSDPSISAHFNPALPFFATAVLALLSLLSIVYFFV